DSQIKTVMMKFLTRSVATSLALCLLAGPTLADGRSFIASPKPTRIVVCALTNQALANRSMVAGILRHYFERTRTISALLKPTELGEEGASWVRDTAWMRFVASWLQPGLAFAMMATVSHFFHSPYERVAIIAGEATYWLPHFVYDWS